MVTQFTQAAEKVAVFCQGVLYKYKGFRLFTQIMLITSWKDYQETQKSGYIIFTFDPNSVTDCVCDTIYVMKPLLSHWNNYWIHTADFTCNIIKQNPSHLTTSHCRNFLSESLPVQLQSDWIKTMIIFQVFPLRYICTQCLLLWFWHSWKHRHH